MRPHSFCIAICILLLSIDFQPPVTFAQSVGKPVLAIFHGAAESRSDMTEMAQASHSTKIFSQVVVIGFDWTKDAVAEAAPRIFNSLNGRFPSSKFVLLGSGEGGLIAEWIATRVKEADSKIARVITINTPLEEAAGQKANAALTSGPNAGLARALKEAPVNDLAMTEFIRLWEKDNKVVAQESALPLLSAMGPPTSRLIVRTKPFDPREVIPEMLAQAKKDFESEQFAKVIDSCRYIVKFDPKHGEANGLLGLSLYSSAMHESDQAQAKERFGESIQYLIAGLAGGMEYKMPAAHHHNVGTTPFGPLTIGDVCYGYMFFGKGLFGFVSADSPNHRFFIPVSKAYNLSFDPNGSGRLHLEVGFIPWRGKEEKRRTYNFLPVRVTKSTTILSLPGSNPLGINKIGCNQGEGCHLGLQALYRLIAESQKLPNTSGPATAGDAPETIETVHYALLARNRHAGVMSFSASGLQWKETSSNADPKHDFSVPWDAVKKTSSVVFGLDLVIEVNKKTKLFWIQCDPDGAAEIAKLLLKHGGVSTQPW